MELTIILPFTVKLVLPVFGLDIFWNVCNYKWQNKNVLPTDQIFGKAGGEDQILFDSLFQKKEPLAILRRLEVQLNVSLSETDSTISNQIYAFMTDVDKCPGISVLGFMDLNKESAATVSQ